MPELFRPDPRTVHPSLHDGRPPSAPARAAGTTERPTGPERAATRTAEPDVEEGAAVDLAPRYQVVLLDDDHHTYEYVIEMLCRLFGFDPIKAFLLAREVDTEGRAVVYVGPLEIAELKRDQIHSYGADPRIRRSAGSMSAVIEPAA